MYNFFDTHAHIHDKAFDDDRVDVLARMEALPMAAITIGTDKQESQKAVQVAQSHSHVYAAVGLHPADNVLEEFDYGVYKHLAEQDKVVALGECGLDYYYVETFFEKDKQEKGISWNKDAEVDRQKRIFEEHINLASELRKPLMLHIRDVKGAYDAYEDALHMLENAQVSGKNVRGNVHFFAGNIDIAQKFLDIGFTISFPGTITFTKEYDDVVRFVPLDMLHAETDSPYAAPVPYRGKRNEPVYVQEVVAKIAVLKEMPMEEVRVQLLENAKRVFGLTF